MKNSLNSNAINYSFGAVFVVTVGIMLSALIANYSLAEDVNANVNIDNDAPVVDGANAQVFQDPADDGTNSSLSGWASALTAPTVSHTIGGNTNVIIRVNVSDSNGWASQPVNLSVRMRRTTDQGTNVNVLGQAWDASAPNDWYILPRTGPSACSVIANVSATERTFLCGVNMKYNTAPTTAGAEVFGGGVDTTNLPGEHWRPVFRVSDGVVNVEFDDEIHVDFSQTLAMTTSTLIDLGTITTDGTPGPTQNLTINNIGNQMLDVTSQATETVDADAWTCTGTGNPLISDLHATRTGLDTNYSSMSALTVNGSPATAQFDLGRATTDTAGSSDDAIFRMATTQGITPGTCTLSSIVLTAIKGF